MKQLTYEEKKLIGILKVLFQNYAVSFCGLRQGWWIVERYAAEQIAMGQEWGGGVSLIMLF